MTGWPVDRNALHLAIDMLEPRVAVGVTGASRVLLVRLQAEAQTAQQAADQLLPGDMKPRSASAADRWRGLLLTHNRPPRDRRGSTTAPTRSKRPKVQAGSQSPAGSRPLLRVLGRPADAPDGPVAPRRLTSPRGRDRWCCPCAQSLSCGTLPVSRTTGDARFAVHKFEYASYTPAMQNCGSILPADRVDTLICSGVTRLC
jgi:hypothetical protein